VSDSSRGVIALDVYGTVIDTAGIATQLEKTLGTRAQAAARLWREKQLEYTFRRALMRRYADFDVCTAQALRFVSTHFGVSLGEGEERALLESYRRLPAFPDVRPGLERLRNAGHTLVALTNGVERSVRGLLEHARIDAYFDMILSADQIPTFKPDPAVYALLAPFTDASPADACLVSANAFDVIGAKACGLKSAWLRRDPANSFDPWEFPPDVVVQTLEELSGEVQRLAIST
jgi:2-haloacid dehalogenase